MSLPKIAFHDIYVNGNIVTDEESILIKALDYW